MAQLLLSPVTLIVKAPNQKIDDQKIECTVDWTVNELKRHLSKVYPTNPMESQQRIIYSGRLLQDTQRLKDVLKQYEPDQNVHTIHLVCSASMSQCPDPSNQPADIQNIVDISLDGIRRRHTQAEQQLDPSAATTSAYSPMDYRTFVPHPGMMYYYGPLNAMAMTSTMPHPVAGYVPYGTHQWMQQAYAQSVMQYMQHYQQVASQPQLIPQMPPGIPAAPANQNFPNEFPGAAMEPELQRQAIGMNAHGGRDVDADDDGADRANRDWLDTTYSLVRLMMLMSILFLYSTPQRFLVTFVVAAMFYIYRAGWLRRVPVENRNRAQAAGVPEERNNETPEARQDEQQSDNSEPDATMINLRATHRPSTFELVWSVISSFFTSLIPENPAPINVN